MYGLENCVDFLSSAVVLWRFFAPSSITKALEAKLQSREKRASVAISMILVVLGLGTWIAAIEDLLRGQEKQDQQEIAIVISLVSCFLFGILTVFKFHYAKVLDSPSLYKDGICSSIGTILSASLFVDTLIITATPQAWLMDPIVAIGCGLAALAYGLWTLHAARYKSNWPIFSRSWWFLNHGDSEQREAAAEDPGESDDRFV